LMARARSGQYRAVLDELFPGFVHPSRRDDASLRQLVHDMGDDVGVEGFVRQQTAMIGRPDSRPALAWIKCPTLVLTGDEDNTIPNSLSKEMADGIHGAKLVILQNCGHLPQPEQPEATAAALVEWLRS
jgi:pimeloyl-ACP methyl ester carboxylesterase